MNARQWGLVLVAVIAAAGGWYWYTQMQKPAAPIETAAAPAPLPPPAPPPAPDYPVPTGGDAGVLPELDASDTPFRAALVALSAKLGDWLVPDLLIRKIVATIDNLARDHAAVNLRPVKRAPGEFRVSAGGPERWVIDPSNDARYDGAVAAFTAIDPQALVALYFKWYPRFQKAYDDLGFPGKSFNNRVVAVIDNLLAAPDPGDEPLLAKPKVYYEYADQDLESRSAGQKLLMRIGVAHRTAVKAQLKAIRAAIVEGGPAKH